MTETLHHAWRWLNQGQRAPALEALASVATIFFTGVYTAAAIFAGLYAKKAFEVGKETLTEAKKTSAEAHYQAQYAKDQATAAQEQTRLAYLIHTESEQRRADGLKLRRHEEYDRIRKLQDTERANRPRFVDQGGFSWGDSVNLLIRNTGLSDAFDVKFCGRGDDEVTHQWALIRAGEGKEFPGVNTIRMRDEGCLITFRTISGTAWTCRIYLNRANVESLVNVVWAKNLPPKPDC